MTLKNLFLPNNGAGDRTQIVTLRHVGLHITILGLTIAELVFGALLTFVFIFAYQSIFILFFSCSIWIATAVLRKHKRHHVIEKMCGWIMGRKLFGGIQEELPPFNSIFSDPLQRRGKKSR